MSNPILHEAWVFCKASDRLSDGSYDPAKVLNVSKSKVTSIYHDHDYCYILKQDSYVVINVEGSDDFKDWINNFRFFKSHDFHKGFREVLRSGLYVKVKDVLNSIGHKKDLLFCGHSRGGALAQLLAYHYSAEHNRFVSCIIFGSPRVGGENYRRNVARISMRLTNVINPCDPVPKLPLKGFGYHHAGSKYIVKPKWYHRLPFVWSKIRAHLDYGKVI
jgi:hypothetical protein